MLLIGGEGFLGTLLRSRQGCFRESLVMGRPPKGSSVANILQELRESVDTCVYLAWTGHPGKVLGSSQKQQQENLKPLQESLSWAVANRLRKFVFISSGGTVYGNAGPLPIPETQTCLPICEYGQAKLDAEIIALETWRRTGLPVVIVRPSNIFGPHQKRLRGQGLIATAIHAFRTGLCLEDFGGEHSVRDYLHEDDFAKALEGVLQVGHDGEVYNLGSGKGTSNAQVIRMIADLAKKDGLSPNTVQKSPRPCDVKENTLKIEKICKATGWIPQMNLLQSVIDLWEASNPISRSPTNNPKKAND